MSELQVMTDEMIKANEEIDFFGTALRPFFETDVAYAAVRSVVMSKLYDQMDLQAEVESKAESAAEAAKSETAELYAQLEERDVIITGLKQDLYEMKLIAEDNAKKRDSAYVELLEAQRTIDGLNDKIAAPAAPVTKSRTNVEGDNSIELFKQSLPAIYDVQDHPDDNRKFIAKMAATDEAVEGLWIYKNGKYREVSAEQAETFRTEYEARRQAEANSIGPVEMEEQPVTVPTFSEEEYIYSVPTVGLVDSTPEVDRGPVTREEFEALSARVAAVEAQQSAGTVAA